MRMQGWAASALLIVCGCAAQRASAPYQGDIDQVLARPASSDRHEPAHDHAWHVGQWVLYGVRLPRVTGYTYAAVVAEDACGVWLQSIVELPTQRTERMICMRADAPPESQRDVAAALDRIEVVITRVNGGPPTTVDFRGHAEYSRRPFQDSIAQFLGPMVLASTAETQREDVDVPAGISPTRRARPPTRRTIRARRGRGHTPMSRSVASSRCARATTASNMCCSDLAIAARRPSSRTSSNSSPPRCIRSRASRPASRRASVD